MAYVQQRPASYYARLERDRVSKRHLKRYRDNKEQILAKLGRYLRRLKEKVFSHYCRGPVRCSNCPEIRLGALTIDHVTGGGNDHRRSIKIDGGNAMYKWLKRNDYPEGFRVLCMNCNILAYLEAKRRNACLSDNPRSAAIKGYYAKLKMTVMAALGGRCRCCGTENIDVLTAHHINNDGAAHRRLISRNRSGQRFYAALVKLGDYSGLECRCFSCNCCEEWA
jgi:hypothetical protein